VPGFKLWKQKQNTALERAADCHLEKGYFLKDARLSSKNWGGKQKKTSCLCYFLDRFWWQRGQIIYPIKGSDFVTGNYISY